jgi:hypothetical protein
MQARDLPVDRDSRRLSEELHGRKFVGIDRVAVYTGQVNEDDGGGEGLGRVAARRACVSRDLEHGLNLRRIF